MTGGGGGSGMTFREKIGTVQEFFFCTPLDTSSRLHLVTDAISAVYWAMGALSECIWASGHELNNEIRSGTADSL